jgi:hypothetical protein
MNAGAVVSYFYDDWGSSTQQKVRAIRADSAGNTVWSGGTRDVSTAQSGKGNLSAGPFMNSQIIFAWYDDRLGGAQIFAQNLSENGDPGPLDYSFGLYPDTLYFLTEQDIHDGKPFYIVNPHDYSLGIQSIDQEGQFYNAPASWYTLPHYTQFPVTMPPMDSIADTVHWIILLKNAFTTLLYDTLEIRSLSQTSRLILALDSSLIITGVPGQEEEILTASPNPFTGPVRITGNFFNARQITVTVYNTLMQPVTRPVNILVPNGRLDFRWDGKDACGNRVSTGVYFITLKGTSGMKTIRVIAF